MHRYSPDMDFLIVYSRSRGELQSVEAFENGESAVAALNAADVGSNDPDIETVLLGSDSFETLKVTHGRYFMTAPKDLQPTMR